MTDDRRPTTEHRPISSHRSSLVTRHSSPREMTLSAARPMLLRGGRIVAVKGLGGFHLMADAGNDAAIRRLRESKPRRAKPFAIMARDLAQAQAFCSVPPAAEALLTSAEAPIVLLEKDEDPRSGIRRRRSGAGNWSWRLRRRRSSLVVVVVSAEVAPDNPYLGVMLPYTPLHHLLLRETGFPVVATSGNLSDEPICTDEVEAMQRLGHIADLFLVHDRPIARHVDDSVAWIVRGVPRLLRRARGYAPLPVTAEGRRPDHPGRRRAPEEHRRAERRPPGLHQPAHRRSGDAGGDGRFRARHRRLSAAVRSAAGRHRARSAPGVSVDEVGGGAEEQESDRSRSQHSPAQIASASCPLSPVRVQHHHAHLAACLAENAVDGPALGVTWDGTGYGIDGTIWGGEFLLGDASGFERVAHLRPFRLPGGDAAVKEPRRVALALLWELYRRRGVGDG